MSDRQKGVSVTTYLILGVLVLFGFVATKNFLANKTSSTQESTVSTSGLDYPELYKNENLPEYEDATLTDIGRQQTSIKDGLRLTLTSPKSVKEISAYYEGAMESLGWTVPTQKITVENLYLGSYTKEDLYYQITVTKLPDTQETQISIVFAQN